MSVPGRSDSRSFQRAGIGLPLSCIARCCARGRAHSGGAANFVAGREQLARLRGKAELTPRGASQRGPGIADGGWTPVARRPESLSTVIGAAFPLPRHIRRTSYIYTTYVVYTDRRRSGKLPRNHDSWSANNVSAADPKVLLRGRTARRPGAYKSGWATGEGAERLEL